MITFETLDKQNFVTLSETEMMETEGGEVLIITGAMVLKGLAALGAGITVGKLLAGK